MRVTPVDHEFAIVLIHRMLPRTLFAVGVVKVDFALVIHVLREIARQRGCDEREREREREHMCVRFVSFIGLFL